MLKLPEDVQFAMNRLQAQGYEAYAVGGCVRDSLLGLTPKDWDMCTSARPDEMQRVFSGCHVVETGLKHGTLTVVLDHVPYEVTTFRVDGEYTDHRHPDGVTFVTDVRADLARRDFTVNAMAYAPDAGLVDAFGGQEDLQRRSIRCVGDPTARFTEDALRILRALRFAAVYDFTIEDATSAAVHRLYPTLEGVAQERIRTELGKLLCGKAAGRILREYSDVITFILPELKPSVGFEQHTPYHRFDVYEHTVRAVECIRPDEALRMAMLLHDSGKPAAFTMDERGIGHAYGHQKISRQLAEEALTRLRYDNATFDRVLLLVEKHDIDLQPSRNMTRRRLAQFGEETLRLLIEVQRADALAKGTSADAEIEAWIRALSEEMDDVLAEAPCLTLKQLALNGRDLKAAGFPAGKCMGACLQYLLTQVVDENIPNEKKPLLDAAFAWLKQQPETPT